MGRTEDVPMTEHETQELEVRRALSDLRHMYQQMVGGHVRPTQEDIRRIAEGVLSPAIRRLEDLADVLMHLAVVTRGDSPVAVVVMDPDDFVPGIGP
jgi:hypothetical protein